MLAFDWRTMFVVMGVVGVVSAGIWFLLYRDPRKAKLQPEDVAYLADNRANANKVEARQWVRLFRFRSMWGLALGAFCTGYAVWMYQTWLPAYLEMQQHISIKNTGYLASIPLVLLDRRRGQRRLGVPTGWRREAPNWSPAAGMPAILGLVLSGVFTYAATHGGNRPRWR